jgi:hypothetical protein
MDPPFEYCALQFLIQWEKKEKGLYGQISCAPTVASIRSALSYFRVARTFKGLTSDDTAQTVLQALCAIDSQKNLHAVQKVKALVTRFEALFGKRNLSASSKLLWLRNREPYIIYDSRAVTALRKVCGRLDTNNYEQYCELWRGQYEKRTAEIQRACSRLHKARIFLPRWYASDNDLNLLASHPWFQERVFDTFLWEVGDSS